ncbi:MAG TPA: glycosyltransferase family 4 protein [Bryobacteraceae bacterium]|jgi:glycosyltransferase involved in cell wall biosynthesis|nr:glycosyltransferase family 4 protein [Bryobacteraceae bacterium]
MKIAVVVHGRFHAFDLARALLGRGNDVQVFTNYPVWAARKFGLPDAVVHSCWPHGVATRFVEKLGRRATEIAVPAVHTTFSKWAADRLKNEQWDVVHTFSGVGEDIFRSVRCNRHFLVRGSAHIRTQRQILDDESTRSGVELERPGEWIIEREEREYQMCDRLLVLSTFAMKSFLERGVPTSKLALLPLGVDLRAFRPPEEVLERRRRRILEGEPLTVLFTGTLNFRKGLYDIDRIIRSVDCKRFRFRVIGSIPPEAKELVAKFPESVEFVPRQPQARLPEWYAGGDLFLFPTLEDGFAVVLTQAYAGALPILTTANCAGPDIVRHGETGWILPIRNADAFIEQLRWCDENREMVAGMIDRIHDDFHARSWDHVAADFETIARETKEAQRG